MPDPMQAACSAAHAARPARASVSRWLRRHAGAWPRQCELCRAWGRTPLCGACVSRFAAERPRCRRCALPVQTLEVSGSDVCGECLREPPPFDAAVAALDYGFPWDGLIARFKFRLPAGCLQLRARVNYRRFNQEYSDYVFRRQQRELKLPVVRMAAAEIVLAGHLQSPISKLQRNRQR